MPTQSCTKTLTQSASLLDKIAELKRTNQARDRLLDSMPHELRTRCTVVSNVHQTPIGETLMTTTLFDKTMGKILLWNEGARRLYGYEPEEVVGKANSSIGLALTRKIVVLQGGVIDVESEPGKGSTFTVELPIRHEQIAQEADHS